MAKHYDISKRITNELPTIKITDDIVCTVNNRKQTVLNVQAMSQQKTENEENEDNAGEEYKRVAKALEMLLGEKNANAIEELNLPLPEYQDIFRSVMNVAQGLDPEETDTPS